MIPLVCADLQLAKVFFVRGLSIFVIDPFLLTLNWFMLLRLKRTGWVFIGYLTAAYVYNREPNRFMCKYSKFETFAKSTLTTASQGKLIKYNARGKLNTEATFGTDDF